jgi:tetratricopeptide (TPR) repeat protein
MKYGKTAVVSLHGSQHYARSGQAFLWAILFVAQFAPQTIGAQLKGSQLQYAPGEVIDATQSNDFVTVISAPNGSKQVFFHDPKAGNKLVQKNVPSGGVLPVEYWNSQGQLVRLTVCSEEKPATASAPPLTPTTAANVSTAGSPGIGLAAPRATQVVEKKVPKVTIGDYAIDMAYAEFWPTTRMPLKLFIKSCTDVPEFDPAFVDVFKSACNDWSTVSQNRISFTYVEKAEEADMAVAWSADTSKWPSDPKKKKDLLGLTSFTRTEDGVDHADIFLLTQTDNKKLPLTGMKEVCLHEIGHSLGLGHSPIHEDIMFPSTDAFAKRGLSDINLTSRDITTLKKVYQARQKVDEIKAHATTRDELYMRLNNLAGDLINAGEYSQAIIYLEQLLFMAPSYNIAKGNLLVASYNCAVDRMKRGLYREALPLFKQSLELAQKVGGSGVTRTDNIARTMQDCQRAASTHR